MQLLIVDGLNLIRRIHAAVSNSHNEDVQASMERSGKAVLSMLEHFQPSHAVVCFDGPELSWRHLEYPGYKAGRKPMPGELKNCLREFRQHFADLGIASLALPAVEADDLAATLTQKMLGQGGQVVLVSTDKGFAQLLKEDQPGLVIWNHFERSALTAEDVIAKWGVPPHRLTDLWGLAGDSTNQIAGVKGIGLKTAQQLLGSDLSLEQLYETLSEVASERQAEKLREGESMAYLSRRLVTLQTDFELGCKLSDFRCKTGAYQSS